MLALKIPVSETECMIALISIILNRVRGSSLKSG